MEFKKIENESRKFIFTLFIKLPLNMKAYLEMRKPSHLVQTLTDRGTKSERALTFMIYACVESVEEEFTDNWLGVKVFYTHSPTI